MKDSIKEKISSNMGELFTPNGIQKYILGYKSSGKPRAVYDVIRDFTGISVKEKDNKKKKKHHKNDSTFSLYLTNKKKKKKKNKKKNKYWHI